MYHGSSSLIEQVSSYSVLGVPSITISRMSTNTITVSWPSLSTGWTLQQNTNSVSSANWSNVTSGIQDAGGPTKMLTDHCSPITVSPLGLGPCGWHPPSLPVAANVSSRTTPALHPSWPAEGKRGLRILIGKFSLQSSGYLLV